MRGLLYWRGGVWRGGGFGRLAGVSQEFLTYRADRRRLYWPSNSIVEGAAGDKWLMGMAGMRLGKWRGLARGFERGVLLQHTHCSHSWKGSVLGAGPKGSWGCGQACGEGWMDRIVVGPPRRQQAVAELLTADVVIGLVLLR